MAPANLKPLTSLRFLAALWVVLYSYWPDLAGWAAPRLVSRGALGVEVFFTLSGFILCHVYLPAWEAGRFRYGPFLWARLARIYPLHLATLAGIGVLGGVALSMGLSIDANALAWDALPANILLLQAWGFAKVAGWNHPSWSISAEWAAYLTFPAYAWMAARLSSKPLAATLGALVLLAAMYALFERLVGFPLTEATIAWGALRIVPCFTLGCALYLLWRSDAVSQPRIALAGAGLSFASLLLAASTGASDAAVVASGGALIFFLAACARTGSRLLCQGPLVYLGEISYALYMVAIPWQLAFTHGAARLLGVEQHHLPVGLWITMLGSAIGAAAAAHHLVERPAREGVRLWGAEVFGARQVAAT